MKKIFIFLILIFTSYYSYSQEIRIDTITTVTKNKLTLITVTTVPKYILEVNGSFNFGAMELNSHNGGFSKYDFVTGKTFGARLGLGFDAFFKIALHKKGNFWFDFTAGYNRFQSDLVVNNSEMGRVGYNHFFFGPGIEYNFTPNHKVKYYAGLTSLFSIIGGNAELLNDQKTAYYDVKINPGFRIGYSAIMGLNYGLSKDVGWNLGLKFTHANLLLKKTEKPLIETETELNDDSTDPRELYSGWKQFSFVTVSTGISYFFKVKDKRYKLN